MKTETDFIGADEVGQYADTPDSINDDEEDFEIYFIDDDDVEIDELMELLDRDINEINSDDIDFILENLEPDLPAVCYSDETAEIVDPIVDTDLMQTIDPSLTSTTTPIDVHIDGPMSRISETDSTFDEKINSDPKGNSVDDDDMTSDLNAIYTGNFETIQAGFPILREQSQDLMLDPSLNKNS